MPLATGTRLGHYEILEPIGSGGMGEVYRARDTKLDRQVALKLLREELTTDPRRVKRFEQEARAASALNHPNIVHIYDIGEHEGRPFIAMELVEGRTLRALLDSGPLPTKTLLDLGTQLAEGLAKAHAAGIVHRDLKPENIVVTEEGLLKILDFGLAKLVPGPSPEDSEVKTRTKATVEGTILGTVPYMSPEQAAGRPVDFRSDQFALGSILYEMATGRVAFEKETIPQTQAAIIEAEPRPLAELNPQLPGQLTAIVRRCLSKDPQQRYDSTRDLSRELASLQQTEAPVNRRRFLLRAAGVFAAVLVIALGLQLRRSVLEPPSIDSLAVLPLKNLSGDPEQEYFADGMTEALISDVAKIGSLKVISSTSALRYKNTDKPLPQIARELNVDAVLEGSVLRVGERVRINAQLIEAATDQHLWADSYERDLRDVLSLQREVARAIADEIRIQLTSEESALLSRASAVKPQAHEAYLKGRFYWNKKTPQAYERANEYFTQAIEIDPNYALAHAALADTYTEYGYSGFNPPSDFMPKAKAAALEALELDDTLAEAHSALGLVKVYYDWDWSGAEIEFQKAIEINPSYARAHAHYAKALLATGHLDEALIEARQAQELDPLDLLMNANLAYFLYLTGRYNETISQCQKTLEMEPDYFLCHNHLFLTYWQQGMFDQALESLKRLYTVNGDAEAVAALEEGYVQGGPRGAAKSVAEYLVAQSSSRYILPAFIALMFAHAEEKGDALRWLEKAVDERFPAVFDFNTTPAFKILHAEPRFQELLQRVGLPEPQPGQ